MVRFLPSAAAAASGILVGSAIVATRFVIDQTAPASLALLPYLIGFCCLLPPDGGIKDPSQRLWP